MAVSQFLRAGSLMDAVKGYLTPETVRSASTLVGESESSTRQALNSAVQTVLSGLTSMVWSRDGASSFGGIIRDGGFGSVVDNVERHSSAVEAPLAACWAPASDSSARFSRARLHRVPAWPH